MKLHTFQVCLCRWTFFENSALNPLLRNFPVPCSHSQLVHSADAFEALWLIVLAVLASIEKPHAHSLYIQSCYVCFTLAIYMLNHTIWTIYKSISIYTYVCACVFVNKTPWGLGITLSKACTITWCNFHVYRPYCSTFMYMIYIALSNITCRSINNIICEIKRSNGSNGGGMKHRVYKCKTNEAIHWCDNYPEIIVYSL